MNRFLTILAATALITAAGQVKAGTITTSGTHAGYGVVFGIQTSSTAITLNSFDIVGTEPGGFDFALYYQEAVDTFFATNDSRLLSPSENRDDWIPISVTTTSIELPTVPPVNAANISIEGGFELKTDSSYVFYLYNGDATAFGTASGSSATQQPYSPPESHGISMFYGRIQRADETDFAFQGDDSVAGGFSGAINYSLVPTTPDPTPVPEPGSLLAFGIGGIGMIWGARRRRSSSKKTAVQSV